VLSSIGSSGTYVFLFPTPGHKILRVTAKDRDRKERQVIRSILPVPVDNQFCHVYLINRRWRVQGSTFIVEFTSTGIASGFMCVLDRQSMKNCEFTAFGYVDICFQYHFMIAGKSPLVLTNLDPGPHHVRVIPQGCGRDYTVWKKNFVIDS